MACPAAGREKIFLILRTIRHLSICWRTFGHVKAQVAAFALMSNHYHCWCARLMPASGRRVRYAFALLLAASPCLRRVLDMRLFNGNTFQFLLGGMDMKIPRKGR
jgi:hypothetical protein